MLWDILFVVSVVGVTSAFFGHLLWKSEIESVRYRLFAVRDKLILMVARGQLRKDSAVFEHYYRSVNDILRMTETMHLEGVIQAWSTDRLSKNELNTHEAQMKRIAGELVKLPEDVKITIDEYYKSLIEMLLVNSNFYKVAYLLSRRHTAASVARWAEKQEPKVAHIYQDIEAERKELDVRCAA